MAANLLRITRGAGKPVYLARQLAECLVAFRNYVDAHGHLPSAQDICSILDPDEAFEDARPWIKERKKRRQADDSPAGEIDREEAMRLVRRGALQVTASMLLDQLTQMRSGESEVYEGIRVIEEVRAKNRGASPKPKPKRNKRPFTL